MSIAAFMQRMRELGAPPEAVEYAVEQMMAERTKAVEVEAVARAEREALAARRKSDADRQWKRRNPEMSRDITGHHEASQDIDEQKEGPQTPKKNTIPSNSTVGSTKRTKRQKPEGTLCPDDLRPSAAHYAKCTENDVPASLADDACRNMYRWSHEHADRDIAWKANWSLALHKFIDGEIEKHQRRTAPVRASPAGQKPSSNGALSRVADLLGVPHEPRTNVSAERDYGPVIDHEGDGRSYRQVREPVGGQPGRFSSEANLRLVSSGRY
jgi:hypothetical protein